MRESLAVRLGYRFQDAELLELALKHRSWCAENPGSASNERLEFLGDAILGHAIADHLYLTFSDLSEGALAKVRASVVSSTALAGVAREIELGEQLYLGKGEASSGGSNKPSILADALEAVFGAIYLDGGWQEARRVIVAMLAHKVDVETSGPGGGDYKTRLQELVARDFGGAPIYIVRSEGPEHAKHFEADVHVEETLHGRGEGASKKEAEQAAAKEAFEHLNHE